MYSEVFPSFLTKFWPISYPFDINRAPPALPVPPPRLVWIPSARPPEFLQFARLPELFDSFARLPEFFDSSARPPEFFFWQEDCFWSSFAGFEVKVKFSFCCRYFQFFQQKLAYVTLTLCNLMTFIHRAAAGSWRCFITSYLDIETAPALPLNKLQTTVLGQVFKISQASDLNLIHWVQKKFSHQKRFQMM